MKIVYSDGYFLPLGEHVFPAVKYRLVRERLLEEEVVSDEDFMEPVAASREDLLLAHTEEYVDKLERGFFTPEELMQHEIPFSRKLVDAFFLAAGGTRLAGERALGDGIGINLGGGFHHAFAGHGEGFCLVNDVAVAARRLRKDGRIRRAMVVDCDVHQGNGTASIFANDSEVFTLSIHQANNYPFWKPPSDLDIHLPNGIQDADYLLRLGQGLEASLARFTPDLIFYVAGADPYVQDQLGGLGLTLAGLEERDRLVLSEAGKRNIPVCITLAGGYANRVEDTITIHANMVKVAWRMGGFPPSASPPATS